MSLSSNIADWTPAELERFVKGKMTGQPIGNIAGLAEAIANARPLVTLDLIGSPAAGMLRADGGAYPKDGFPRLDERLAAAGYPWGSSATHFILPDLTPLDPDPDIGYFMRAS